MSMSLLSALPTPPSHSIVTTHILSCKLPTFLPSFKRSLCVKWKKEFCHNELQLECKPTWLNSTAQSEGYFICFFCFFFFLFSVTKTIGGLKGNWWAEEGGQPRACGVLSTLLFDIFSRRSRITATESYFSLVFPPLGSAELWADHSIHPAKLLHSALWLFVLCANFHQGQNAIQSPIWTQNVFTIMVKEGTAGSFVFKILYQSLL